MNMKKIISTALMVVMLLTSIIAVLPMGAFAAVSSTQGAAVEESELNMNSIRTYINEYIGYTYADAETMLKAEQSKVDPSTGEPLNLLVSVSSPDDKYTIHINRYTGFVYYVNNVTGQIFTSNPTDPGSTGASEQYRKNLMSQIMIDFTEISTSTGDTYYSTPWAAHYAQISVSKINGGLRVNYTLGDTSRRFLLPGRISAKDFHDDIFLPLATAFQKLFKEAIEDAGADPAEAEALVWEVYEPLITAEFNKRETKEGLKYTDKESPYYEYLTSPDLAGTVSKYVLDTDKVELYLNSAKAVWDNKTLGVKTEYKKELNNMLTAIRNFLRVCYVLQDINSNDYYDAEGNVVNAEEREKILKDFPLCETMPVYSVLKEKFDNNDVAFLRQYSTYITTYVPSYTMEMMYEDESECGFEYASAQKPVFRCALEYTFNSDGSLSVRLPANSIVFDETTYILKRIVPLPFFSCADMSEDGYLFYPDGSGSILDFADFYSDERKTSVNYSSKVYGHDYCYSFIEGAHREQITMPIYGTVSVANATPTTKSLFGVDKIQSGCFVIVEEGSAHASLTFESDASTHKYLWAYAAYAPFPIDKYELSETISVGASSDVNTVVGETKYAGSYVSRIVMLTDDVIGTSLYGNSNYYQASYSGMAAYYRDILKANGTLTAIENVEENIPLYIEALGAMTITDKFLTFPVEKSIPLTTFENVATIYNELANAEKQVEIFYEKYKNLADEAENELLKVEYEQKAKKYYDLIGKIENIKNVNFKLTGFANGGMNSTYPAKLKWEKCCGGKSDFSDLVELAKSENSKTGYNLGIFPDFDFLYISNTASFDGISNKGNVSRWVDNRYASKQVYNSLLGEFETIFSMVISSDTLLGHVENFDEKYSKFEHSQLSVASIGSDLNSNFDEKNNVDREKSLNYIVSTLEEMVYQNGYELMIDTGNIYAAKYADHILNIATDYSAFRFSSYAVPFVGMILHGHISYAASPLNYSGSPAYDILRAIESGANPYYIVAYQNNAYMKDDPSLNKYYGVDYENWYDEILTTYTKMNSVLKNLQDYEIVYHTTVLAERTAEASERFANYKLLKAELLELLRAQIVETVDSAVVANGSAVKVVVDVDGIYSQIVNDILNKYEEEIKADIVDGKNALREAIRLIAVEFATEHPGNNTPVEVKISEVVCDDDYSKYSFTTDSTIYDAEYEATDYTLYNDNVVNVTYKKGTSTVNFILNYNLYDVSVKLDANQEAIVIPMYGAIMISESGIQHINN